MNYCFSLLVTGLILGGFSASGKVSSLTVHVEPNPAKAGAQAKISINISGANKTLKNNFKIYRPAAVKGNTFPASGATSDIGGRKILFPTSEIKGDYVVWIRGYGGGGELHGFKGGRRILRKWVNFGAHGRWKWVKTGVFKTGQYDQLRIIVPSTHKKGKMVGGVDYLVVSEDLHASPKSNAGFYSENAFTISPKEYLSTTFQFNNQTHRPYMWIKNLPGNAANMKCKNAINGFCSRQLAVALPKSNDSSILWLRGLGIGGEVHGYKAGKRVLRKWVNFNARGRWRWIKLGVYKQGSYDKITFIVPKWFKDKKLIGGIDCMLLTLQPDFKPNDEIRGASNVFYWLPGTSSVGEHKFLVTAEGSEGKLTKKITIKVVPENGPDKKKVIKNDLSVKFIPFGDHANLPVNPELDKLKILGRDVTEKSKFPAGIKTKPGTGKVFIGVWAKVSDGELKRRDVTVPQADHNVTEPAQLPVAVTIPVKAKYTQLHFYHTIKGAGEVSEILFKYIVKYSNGTVVEIPIEEGGRIAGQLKPQDISQGKLIYSSVVQNRSVNVFETVWQNPDPDLIIVSIQLKAFKQKVIPVLLGIGGTTGKISQAQSNPVQSQPSVTINFLNRVRPVRNGLFAMNTPYIFRTQSQRYYNLFKQMKFPEVRIWNKIKPREKGAVLSREELDKYDLNVKRLIGGTKTTIMLNLFGDIPKWIIDDAAPDKHIEFFVDWYIAILDYCINQLHWPITSVELFNERLIGHKKSTNLLRYRCFNALAARIKQRYPKIKIGGTAECWPDLRIIDQFVKHCNKNLDILTWHIYATGKTSTPTPALMGKTKYLADVSVQIEKILKKYIPNRKIGQAITEFNINYAAWKPPADLRQSQGDGAVWLLSVLRNLLYTGSVDTAMIWHYWGGSTYGVVSGNHQIRPNGTLYFLLNHYLADAMLLGATSSNPQIEALAAESKDYYIVALINKSDIPQEIKCNLLNAPGLLSSDFSYPITSYQTGGEDTLFSISKTRNIIPKNKVVRLEKFSFVFKVIPKK
jgi:hypothetical protein